MKRYRLWALGVPDLHPDGFQPRLGGMRLFEGGDSGGDSPGGSDARDENTSDYSPSDSGGVDYEALAEASRIAAGATGMNDAKAAAEIADAMESMGYTPYVSDTTSQGAAAQDFATRAAELAALGIDINDPFAGSYQLPVLPTEAAELPEDVEATTPDPGEQAYAAAYLDAINRGASEQEAEIAGQEAMDITDAVPAETQSILSSGMAQEISPPDLSGRLPDTLEDIVSDVASRTYDAAYGDAIARGSSHEEANASASVAVGGIYAGAKGVGTVSPGEREEMDPGYVGGALDVLGDVSGLGVDRPDYETQRGETSGLSSLDRAALYGDTGYGEGFESADARERAQLSNEIDRLVATDVSRPGGVAAVDLLQDEPLGPPPAGFTGPRFEGQLGLSMSDMALKDREDRLSDEPTGMAGASGWTPDTAPREGDPGFMGAVQGQTAETPSGALPGPSGGTPALAGPLTLSEEIAKARTEVAAGRDLTQNLSFLAREGLGAEEGLNPNNPTQSVQEMLNSSRLSDFLDRNMPTIIGAMGPVAQIATEAVFAMKKGYQPSSIVGMIVSSMIGSAIEMATGVRVPGEAVQEFSKGNIGKAAFGIGVQNVAKRVGAPVAAINSVLSGNMGEAASNAILSEVVNESAKQLSTDPGLIARFAVQSGLGQSAFEKITSAINDNSIVKGVNDILGDWSSKLKGITADVPIGEAITSGGTSGALPGQDTYYTSDGGTDSDQTGALPDTTVSGQPKRRIPRWSDLFLGNLARDLSTGFSATPPPAGVAPEDDLNAALEAAQAYQGADGQLVAGPPSLGQADDRRGLLAEYIRYMAESGAEGFRIDPDTGVLSIIDPDLSVEHRFSSDGTPIGSAYRVQIGGPEDRTSQSVSDLLSTDYLQSLFGNRQDQIYSQQVDAENRERLTEEQYRALFQTGESATPPATGSGQAVFGGGTGSFGSKADALSLFPGLSLRERDTGGNEVYENQGFIVYATSDGSVSAVRKDAPDMAPVDLYRPPETQTTTTAPQPELRPEDLLVTPPPPVVQPPPPPPAENVLRPGDQVTAPTPAEREQTEATAPTTPPVDTQQPSTTPSTDVTQGGTTVTPTVTPDQVRQVVQEAMAANPGLTEAQVQQIVSDALAGMPAGITPADVRAAVKETIDALPAPLTREEVAADIGGLRQEVADQYRALSDAQKAEVDNRVQQGQDLSDAISAVQSGLESRIGEVQTDLGGQIGGLRQEVSDQYRALTDAQKQEVDNRVAMGQNLENAIGDVKAGLEQRLSETQTGLTETIGGVQTGLSQQIGDLDTRFNARVDELVQQGQDQQTATNQAISEMSGGLTSLKEQQERDAKLQLSLQQQQGALQTASNLGASGRQQIIDPYKATFKDPFVVGGEAAEFKSPLAGFLGSAMKSSFLPTTPTDTTQSTDRLGSEYFDMPGITGMQNPLDMYVEAPFEGLYGFKAGGMVPLMAQGGTRHGNNAHGALRVLEHSGKHRVDYRQGDAVTGIGDGQSDDIPAMLADGEFVFPADVVAALGNGSTKAGSDKLYEMMHNIRRHHRSTGPKDLPPPAKSPLEYIKPRKGRR